MHFYPHHIGDYKSSTAHLTNDEDLAYRRLLEVYYDTELPIPADFAPLSRKLRVSVEAIAAVLGDFFVLADGGYRNKRADIEIANFQSNRECARVNGRKGGRPKKNQTLTQNNPAGFFENPTLTQSKPKLTQPKGNQEPVTINQEPVTTDSILPSVVLKASPKKVKRVKGVALPMPADWGPKETHKALARRLGMSEDDLDICAIGFRGWAEKGKVQISWDGAFTQWLASPLNQRRTIGGMSQPNPATGKTSASKEEHQKARDLF